MKFLPVIFLALLLGSCATGITREEAIATAYEYTQVRWTPDDRHVRHGPDANGLPVHTPDISLRKTGDHRGWWKPGTPATGMPYQWGGFDTPESFLEKISAGHKAGDIASGLKRTMGDAGTSAESCGIDCSGFVSRCWGLKRPYSTARLPEICDPLGAWSDLQPGDILLNDKHVVLFVKWAVPDKELVAYEAGPYPVWRVSACGLSKAKLVKEGYAPWRYRKIMESPKLEAASISDLAREWR